MMLKRARKAKMTVKSNFYFGWPYWNFPKGLTHDFASKLAKLHIFLSILFCLNTGKKAFWLKTLKNMLDFVIPQGSKTSMNFNNSKFPLLTTWHHLILSSNGCVLDRLRYKSKCALFIFVTRSKKLMITKSRITVFRPQCGCEEIVTVPNYIPYICYRSKLN